MIAKSWYRHYTKHTAGPESKTMPPHHLPIKIWASNSFWALRYRLPKFGGNWTDGMVILSNSVQKYRTRLAAMLYNTGPVVQISNFISFADLKRKVSKTFGSRFVLKLRGKWWCLCVLLNPCSVLTRRDWRNISKNGRKPAIRSHSGKSPPLVARFRISAQNGAPYIWNDFPCLVRTNARNTFSRVNTIIIWDLVILNDTLLSNDDCFNIGIATGVLLSIRMKILAILNLALTKSKKSW